MSALSMHLCRFRPRYAVSELPLSPAMLPLQLLRPALVARKSMCQQGRRSSLLCHRMFQKPGKRTSFYGNSVQASSSESSEMFIELHQSGGINCKTELNEDSLVTLPGITSFQTQQDSHSSTSSASSINGITHKTTSSRKSRKDKPVSN